MGRYISLGTYGVPKSNKDDNGRQIQLALVNGVSYEPDFSIGKVTLSFHKNSGLKKEDDNYHILELDLQEAQMLTDTLRNITAHLEQKMYLAREGLLKDNCYNDDDEDTTF